MNQTRTDHQQRIDAPQQAPTGNVVRAAPPRLPCPVGVEERFGIDKAAWKALVEAVWPLAKSPDAIVLALAYCKARRLDPFKRVVHIVPMWNGALGREVETVWPGIAEHRTTAFRTGKYAGADPVEFGPTRTATFEDKDRKGNKLTETVTFPEWAQITIYRLVDGNRVPFPGPRCYWTEYFSGAKGLDVPNARWSRAPFQMLEKCAEAAALRRAFPEEFGDEATADEMEGREYQGADAAKDITPEQDIPARPTRQDTADDPAHVVDAEYGEIADGDEAEADRLARQFAATGTDPTESDAEGEPTEVEDPAVRRAAEEQAEKIIGGLPGLDTVEMVDSTIETLKPIIDKLPADLVEKIKRHAATRKAEIAKGGRR